MIQDDPRTRRQAAAPVTAEGWAERAAPLARFWPLWLASVLVPLLIFAAAALWSRNLEQDEVRDRLVRTLGLLREHALRSFERQDTLLAAAQGHTAGQSWDAIGRSRGVSAFLRAIDIGMPDSAAIALVAPSG